MSFERNAWCKPQELLAHFALFWDESSAHSQQTYSLQVAALLLVLLPSLPRDLSGLRYLSPILSFNWKTRSDG